MRLSILFAMFSTIFVELSGCNHSAQQTTIAIAYCQDVLHGQSVLTRSGQISGCLVTNDHNGSE